MGWLRDRLRSYLGVEPPKVAPAKRPALKVSDGALSGSSKKPAAQVQVFAMPAHPPGVGTAAGRAPALAMDSDVGAVQSWANLALASFPVEGVTFLGYAFLSELAQRPEYRVISETLASEMTRKWIRFTSTDQDDDKTDRITELETEFARLRVRDLFCRAAEQDGFFGRGHIYLDTGATDDPEELKKPIGDGWNALSKAKVKKGDLKQLRTVEAVWCYPTNYNSNDPLKSDWYAPTTWYVQAKIVHSTRLLTFIGREVPDLLKPTYSFGGLSLSQMSKPYVDNWLETRQSVNDIIHSFSVFALLTNLGESLQGDGDQLFRRATLFNNVRDNRGLMMLDKETEDFKNVAAPLSGLDQLQAQAQEHMASVSHIPTVKLLGIQPAGLNADSEGVMRAFYDYIHSFQEHFLRDKIRAMMGFAMLNIWGETDPKIDFEFVPLRELSEKEEAEVQKAEAETDGILIDHGVIAPAEARRRVAAESSAYASLDEEDAPDLLDEEEEGLEPEGGRPNPVAGKTEERDKAA